MESNVSAKTMPLAKWACIVGLVLASALLIVGCSTPKEGYTGGVAATVNGVEIPEDDVTDQIQSMRSQMDLEDQDAWGQWLAQNSYTPESLREQVIDSLVNQELVKQGAKDADITVDSSEIDGYVNQMKSNYDSDEAWQSALKSAGFTEQEYRDQLESSLLSQKFQDSLTADENATDEEKLEYAKSMISTYDGAKRSSHILFSTEDQSTAQQVLDQLNSGQIDFATAVQQYSIDEGSKAQGGDVGWDKLTSFVTEYTDGLAALEPGQTSGLVQSQFGWHIIQCTDKFTAPAELTSLDQLPADFLSAIESQMSSTNKSEAYSNWLNEKKSGDGVVINSMPDGLAYYVDMTQYPSTADSSTTTLDLGGATAEGETSAEGEGTTEGQ